MLDNRDAEDHQRAGGQAKATEGLPGADATFQRRAQQVGAQPPLDIGAGPDPQQVQGHQLGGVAQRLGPLVAQGPGTAAQIDPSTSSPARTATATRGRVKSPS